MTRPIFLCSAHLVYLAKACCKKRDPIFVCVRFFYPPDGVFYLMKCVLTSSRSQSFVFGYVFPCRANLFCAIIKSATTHFFFSSTPPPPLTRFSYYCALKPSGTNVSIFFSFFGQLSEEETAMAGAPQGPVYQVAVLETKEFEPSPNPDEEMKVLMMTVVAVVAVTVVLIVVAVRVVVLIVCQVYSSNCSSSSSSLGWWW